MVVDNASVDGTSARVAEAFPDVRLLARREPRNGRPEPRRAGPAPWIAFKDDDSWWLPGALSLAVESLEGAPGWAVVAARSLLGKSEVIDPVCNLMAASPLEVDTPLPGHSRPWLRRVRRRRAPIRVSRGRRLQRAACVRGERLLAVDLAAAGWFCAYVRRSSPRRAFASARSCTPAAVRAERAVVCVAPPECRSSSGQDAQRGRERPPGSRRTATWGSSPRPPERPRSTPAEAAAARRRARRSSGRRPASPGPRGRTGETGSAVTAQRL